MIKQLLPWPVKVLTKLVLGTAGVDYKLLKRAGVVEFGRMEDAQFANETFDLHVLAPLRERGIAPAGTLLELGPGDSVATGILGRAAGFSQVELIDAGSFADLRPPGLERLLASLGAEPLGLPQAATEAAVLARLQDAGISYRTEGLRSLKLLGSGTITYSFSNTVLQHVYLDELPGLVQELGRLHARGSNTSHSVNFTDHFSGGFVNHSLPAWVMESRLVKRANLYTNRIRATQLLEMFELAGFAVHRLITEFLDTHSPQRCEYYSATDFRLGIGSRQILRVIFLLQKSE
jgi:hypothetical protein